MSEFLAPAESSLRQFADIAISFSSQMDQTQTVIDRTMNNIDNRVLPSLKTLLETEMNADPNSNVSIAA